MMHIWYIHGANATPASFTYIKSVMPEHKITDIVYSANDPIEQTLAKLSARVDGPIHIVSHSLGGVLAVRLSQLHPDKVRSVIAMASPLGGSEMASRMRMLLPFNVFLKNIVPTNSVIRELLDTGIKVPTLKMITTAGASPFDTKQGDGVVTVESQQALKGGVEMACHLNHFEVLLDPNVAEFVRGFVVRFEEQATETISV